MQSNTSNQVRAHALTELESKGDEPEGRFGRLVKGLKIQINPEASGYPKQAGQESVSGIKPNSLTAKSI
jgi:hypothetical protein